VHSTNAWLAWTCTSLPNFSTVAHCWVNHFSRPVFQGGEGDVVAPSSQSWVDRAYWIWEDIEQSSMLPVCFFIFLTCCSIVKWGRLKGDRGWKSRLNFALFHPVKIMGGMGEISEWIFRARPRTNGHQPHILLIGVSGQCERLKVTWTAALDFIDYVAGGLIKYDRPTGCYAIRTRDVLSMTNLAWNHSIASAVDYEPVKGFDLFELYTLFGAIISISPTHGGLGSSCTPAFHFAIVVVYHGRRCVLVDSCL